MSLLVGLRMRSSSAGRHRDCFVRARMAACAVVLGLLVGGCGGGTKSINMMPTPVAFQGGRINVFDEVPQDRRTSMLDVLYATDRDAKGESDDRSYTNGVSDSMELGAATVRFGEEGTSWEQLVEASLAEPRPNPVSLTMVQAKQIGTLPSKAAGELSEGERAFADQVNRELERTAQPEVSIYVHGYRVDFRQSVSVAAQLRHFLGRRQVVVVYAWPCRQGLLAYNADVRRAIDSAPKLATLIEFLATNTRAEHINVLGYSAGATLVVEGLVELRSRYPDLDEAALREKLRVGNVVLAAADVDLKTFVRKQLVELTDLASYVAITISKNDAALKIAAGLRGGSRVGRSSAENLSREELESLSKLTKLQVIDVSAVKGPHSEAGGIGGHGYWYANPWVSSDILTTFIWQLPPEQRGLMHVEGRQSWTFPADYPDRVHTILQDRIRELRAKSATAGS